MIYLANLAPICAIIGFFFIVIKTLVPKHIRLIMCVHIMVLSGIASLLYVIRHFSPVENSLSLALAVIWAWIGFLNHIEYNNLKKS